MSISNGVIIMLGKTLILAKKKEKEHQNASNYVKLRREISSAG